MMMSGNAIWRILLLAVLAAGLAACGRAGDPGLPPAAAAGTQDAAAQDEQSRPVEDKPFILDPLI
jgi:predicted small lipoprotein YifL